MQSLVWDGTKRIESVLSDFFGFEGADEELSNAAAMLAERKATGTLIELGAIAQQVEYGENQFRGGQSERIRFAAALQREGFAKKKIQTDEGRRWVWKRR